nr:dihydrofolate reductase family protein [Leptospira interrogans]
MRKIILQTMLSMNGYFEGPNSTIDWHVVDEEFNKYTIDFLDQVDVLLFGRITYELMANYWPTAIVDNPIIATKMNEITKIVFSKTLANVKWKNSILVYNNVKKEVAKLKKQQGKDIAIFGSSSLAATLIEQKLIDEVRIFISPIVLGEGKTLFQGIQNRISLKLIQTKTFQSGNVLLYYQPL